MTYIVPAGLVVAVGRYGERPTRWQPHRMRRTLQFDRIPFSDGTGCVFRHHQWLLHVRPHLLFRKLDMCNRFEVNTDSVSLAYALGAQLLFDGQFWGEEVFPMTATPAMLHGVDGARELHAMQFGFGAPDRGGATFNNARIENIGKWPWKDAFARHRCIVPITSFREPCYWGTPAGKEVNFYRTDDKPLLAAAGIYSVWVSPDKQQTKLLMSLLMRPAMPYVLDNGHHRSPFFLSPDGFDDWLGGGKRRPKESLEVLKEYAEEPELAYHVAREMGPTWKKRQPGRVRKRDEQLEAIERDGELGF